MTFNNGKLRNIGIKPNLKAKFSAQIKLYGGPNKT